MAAKDSLHARLFHGSRHLIQAGELLDVSTPGYGTDELHAFATNNPENAAQYGNYVYEVSPEGPLHADPYNEDMEYGNPEVKNYSSRAFRVLRAV